MRIKLQHGDAMFDVDSSEARLLADGSARAVQREGKRALPVRRHCASVVGPAAATVKDQTSYIEEINQRANKRTHVMEEILSHHCWHPS